MVSALTVLPTPNLGAETLFATRDMMRKWQCMTCGFIYDEAEGWPDDDLPPGTRWEDVPDDWICPVCGTPKSDFEMVEIG